MIVDKSPDETWKDLLLSLLKGIGGFVLASAGILGGTFVLVSLMNPDTLNEIASFDGLLAFGKAIGIYAGILLGCFLAMCLLATPFALLPLAWDVFWEWKRKRARKDS